jgi:predicted enzyme related to lactoylglutathione lyase
MLMSKHPVGSLGFSAIAADPSGASFGLWQPAEHRGAERFDAPGGMTWAELYTRDGAGADAFYRAALGHAATKVENDKGLDYAEYGVDGQIVCGRLVMTRDWGEVPPHWLTYFGVADTDAAIARLPAIEGKLIHGPFPTPMGPAALVTDPYGALFAIVQRPAPKA